MAGARMLEEIPFGQDDILLKTAYQICRWHHERYDGRGYPDGLVGDDIPIAAQVVGLADVYDALTSDRVYKPAFDHDSAMRMILNNECGVFNPLLLECLRDAEDELQRKLMEDAYSSRMDVDAHMLASEKYAGIDAAVSARTLRLLEYERSKAQFYASISEDILFDYSVNPDLLTISQTGVEKFNLPESIYYPRKNERLLSCISVKDLDMVFEKLKALPREDMRVRCEVELRNGDRKEWYRIIARPIHAADGSHEIRGAVGVASNIHREYTKMLDLEKQYRSYKPEKAAPAAESTITEIDTHPF